MIYKLINWAVMNSSQPSFWLKLLFSRLPKELKALAECPQNPSHHPEGNVWEHTLMVVDQAAQYRSELPEDWQRPYMWGMLYHDVGKPGMTDPDTLKTYGHDELGAELVSQLALPLTVEEFDKVCMIVKNHMKGFMMIKDGAKWRAWRRLSKKIPLNILAYVVVADRDGRAIEKKGKNSEVFKTIMEKFDKLDIPVHERVVQYCSFL